MTELRQRMVNDMILRGMAEKTRTSYTQAVAGLAKFYRRSPDQITHDDVQAYLLHLIQERKLAWSTCKIAVCALRFLFHTTLGQDAVAFHIPGPRQRSKLPLILSRDEVRRILAATTDRQAHALLTTTYAAGLRVSEAVRLKITDLDGTRHTIRVEQGKGAKDRDTVLPPGLLVELRASWRHERPAVCLFPRRDTTAPLSVWQAHTRFMTRSAARASPSAAGFMGCATRPRRIGSKPRCGTPRSRGTPSPGPSRADAHGDRCRRGRARGRRA